MEAPTVGIGRLLKEGGRFRVPNHQRDYSWTEDEIQQLLKDISDAQNSGQDEYFIGLMVFMPESEREFRILDGQQRIATTVILLSAIRTWLRSHGLDDDAGDIQRYYIAARRLGGTDHDPVLVMNENNDSLFTRFVVRESPLRDITSQLEVLKRYDPNRRLLEAISFCRSYIDEIASGSAATDAAAQELYRLVEYLNDGVKVVRLNVSSESNAFTVFETLNDRGLDLSILDLVKNHLFGRSNNDSQLSSVQRRWTQMMANLSNVRADDFLKAWWTSRFGRVQTPQLFAKFKEKVTTAANAEGTSIDLLVASEKYAALEISDDPMWSPYNPNARRCVRSLKLLGARQTHPILLSALDTYDVREIERLLRLLEVLIVRYQLIGGGRTGRLEIACARLAHRIHDIQCNTATDAAAQLKDVLPSDTDFKEAFRTKQERNSTKARYILAELEIAARRSAAGEVGVELEPTSTLTLEHILPKSPEDAWKDQLESDNSFAEDCTHRLGNLCLLTQVNRSLGNRSFEEKKKVFAQSELTLTKQVSDCEEWTREQVEKRQARMAKLAASHWRFQ